ncbi:MAG: terminase large subunit domain-containing protein [Pontimonas sp.]
MTTAENASDPYSTPSRAFAINADGYPVVHGLTIDEKFVKTIPFAWAKLFLDLDTYDWQKAVLMDLFFGRYDADKNKWFRKQVALRAANGSGKTANCATPAVLYFAATHTRSQVVISSGVFRQVKEQLFGYIHDLKPRLGADWELNSTDFRSPTGTRGVGFAAAEPGKFEGFHCKGRPKALLIVLDECKSIPDEIFQAVCRCQPSHLLAMSSPGEARGWFYDAFNKNKKQWSTHHVTAYDCPHLTKEWIDQQIDLWGGLDNPFLRSMILAEFTPEAGWYLFNAAAAQTCMDKPPPRKQGARACFVDWSGGGDETVISFVHGNWHEDMVTFRESNTMAAVARVATEINKRTNASVGKTWIVGGDNGGLGQPMNDSLEQMGFKVHRINNAQTSSDTSRYQNLGAEQWDRLAQRVNKQEVRLYPDATLHHQLTTRKVELTATGKMKLESKDDIRASGGESPDRADATCGAFYLAEQHDLVTSMTETWNVLPDNTGDWDQFLQEGCHAGI